MSIFDVLTRFVSIKLFIVLAINQSCLCQLDTCSRDCSVRCGESYIQPNISTDRIINGEIAVRNSWPYIVYVQIGTQGWYGGSLIDALSVLIAAHCTYVGDTREFTLWFDVHKLDERGNEMNQGIVEKRSVQHIFNHPNYRIRSLKTCQHDLAILRLSRSVHETAFIRYLCLVSDILHVSDAQLNDQVEIIGWSYINKRLSNGTFLRQTISKQIHAKEILVVLC
ncbi:unnamed protein product [Adineta ricciae]|uniref:Peptidase S1 domain-containing protein n=1 Tax=Adineta ricciae TaxID=249248 RepID=A0A813UGI2_ADIRI|nr:unnamed protein product [Adineta ricciae]CAF0925810.1 unnamed protein product [Adineta ricciae]